MCFVTMPILANYLHISAFLLMPICAFIGVVGIFLLFNLDKIPVIKNIGFLEHLLHSLRLLAKNPKASLLSLTLAILGHSGFCLAAVVLVESLGHPLSITASLTLVPWVLLVSIIPISIGGWGLREAAMVYMLSLVGVSQEAALAISVQIGILLIITSLPAGLLWLFSRKATPTPTLPLKNGEGDL